MTLLFQHPPVIEGVEKFIDENGRYDKAAHDDFILQKL